MDSTRLLRCKMRLPLFFDSCFDQDRSFRINFPRGCRRCDLAFLPECRLRVGFPLGLLHRCFDPGCDLHLDRRAAADSHIGKVSDMGWPYSPLHELLPGLVCLWNHWYRLRASPRINGYNILPRTKLRKESTMRIDSKSRGTRTWINLISHT